MKAFSSLFLLFAMGTVILLCAHAAVGAPAATVTLPITCTMDNSAAEATVTLSGGSPSPAAVPCDGNPHDVTVNPSVTLTATEPSDGAHTRDRFSGSASTTPELTCSSGTCAGWSFTNYEQVLNTFEVVANAQPYFDTGMTWTLACTQAGASGSCSIRSTPTPTDSISIWTDYGRSVSFPFNPVGAPANSRWEFFGTYSFNPITGGGTEIVNYFKQVSVNFDYSVLGGGTGFSGPSLTCTQYGATAVCVALSTSPSSLWVDYGSVWSVTNPLPGSTTNERWRSSDASGVAAAGSSTTIQFFHQYSISVGFSVSGGGTLPSAPSISYNLYGAAAESQLNQSPVSVWMDTGQSFLLSQVLGAYGERWASPLTTFRVLEGAGYSITLYHQFEFQLSYGVSGGGSGYTGPDFSFTSFTAAVSLPLTQTVTAYWLDSGTSWAVTNPLAGSGAGERWQTGQATSGNSSMAVTETLTYYHQYWVTFDFATVGGGLGYASPTVSFREFGQGYSSTQGWADAGTTYDYTNPLNGSTSTERWFTADPGGTVTNASTTTKTYYYQFAFTVNYQVIPSSSGYVTPGVNFTAFGVGNSQLLPSSPSITWLDSGTRWSATSILDGSNSVSRWATDIPTSGSATSPQTIVFTYYEQISANFTYSVKLGGSPLPPEVHFTSFGSANQTTLTGGSATVWVDSDSSWSYPDLLAHSNHNERWISNSTAVGSVETPSTISVVYLHQYFLQTLSDSSAGGTILNSTAWYDNGSTVTVNATALQGWKFIYWDGLGGGAYNGSLAFHAFSLAGPANETAIFYPGLAITSTGGGFVSYEVGSLKGNITGTQVVYVPLLSNVTLRAYPQGFDYIFIGWSQYVQGTIPVIHLVADSPHEVTASFSLDYSDLAVVAVFVPIVLVMAVYVLVVRRVRRSPQ